MTLSTLAMVTVCVVSAGQWLCYCNEIINWHSRAGRNIGVNMQYSANDELHVKLVVMILNHKRLWFLTVDEHCSKVHVTHWWYAVPVMHTARPCCRFQRSNTATIHLVITHKCRRGNDLSTAETSRKCSATCQWTTTRNWQKLTSSEDQIPTNINCKINIYDLFLDLRITHPPTMQMCQARHMIAVYQLT